MEVQKGIGKDQEARIESILQTGLFKVNDNPFLGGNVEIRPSFKTDTQEENGYQSDEEGNGDEDDRVAEEYATKPKKNVDDNLKKFGEKIRSQARRIIALEQKVKELKEEKAKDWNRDSDKKKIVKEKESSTKLKNLKDENKLLKDENRLIKKKLEILEKLINAQKHPEEEELDENSSQAKFFVKKY